MTKRFWPLLGLCFGLVLETHGQSTILVLTRNQVRSATAVNIGMISVPTNYFGWIRGDFSMSGSANFAASIQTIAVQNSNGVLYASAPTTLARSSSPGAATWVMVYTTSGSTNVMCQATGVETETWNGRWEGSIQLVPMATEPPATAPPEISAAAVASTNSTDARIVWNTDQAADSTVEWGTTTGYGFTTNVSGLVTEHSVVLNNLAAGTTYHYRISSTNGTGQSVVSADFVFTTEAIVIPPPVISGVAVAATNPTEATVIWNTDQPADSVVEWGTTPEYGSTSSVAGLVTAHSVALNDLAPGTTYHYRVGSVSATEQGSVGGDNAFMTPPGLTNGLAGYWAFDHDYNDASGLGNNLSPVGQPVLSPFGYIYGCMDSDNGCAQVADNPTLGMGYDASFTVSCWVCLQNSSAFCDILAKGTFEQSSASTFMLYNTGSAFRFALGSGSSFAFVQDSSTGNPQPFTWYQIVGAYDSVAHQISVWVNGNSNPPTAWSFGTYHNPGPLSIGASPSGDYRWNGLIDEAILWTNRALTSTEVSQLYANSTRGLTPLTYGSATDARTTIIFNGDARFGVTGTDTNMPDYFRLYSWTSNHNAAVVNYSGGVPPPTPPNVEQIEDLTNSAMTSTVLSYVGPGTNVFWVTEIGINNIYIMQNQPLYGYWTAQTIAYQLTNYFQFLSDAGVKVIPLTVYPMIGLELSPGDGTLANGELVRNYVNRAITNWASASGFAFLDVDRWLQTNSTPMWWGPSESELNDLGNTNVAWHLNALLNSKAP